MTKKVVDLQDRKDRQKLEVISNDLDTVLYLMKLIKSGLMDYQYYIPVKDVMISIANNEKLLQRHLLNVNEKLEALVEDEKSE
jgi:hypothetical protein